MRFLPPVERRHRGDFFDEFFGELAGEQPPAPVVAAERTGRIHASRCIETDIVLHLGNKEIGNRPHAAAQDAPHVAFALVQTEIFYREGDVQRIRFRKPSCGGGVVMREENADHMKKNGRVVLLTAKPETIYERVKDSDERPILNGNMNVEYISGLMEKRKERYEAVADVTVATDGKNVTQICEEIIAKLIALDNEQDNKQA